MHTENPINQPASFEILELDTPRLQFAYDGENLTFTDSDGTFYPCVTLRRSFPLSSEDTYILVRVPDTEEERGYELGVIRDASQLADDAKEAVLRELRLYYFVPNVLQIYSIREEFGFLYWSVETDRGKKDFIMRDNITSSTRRVSEGRWLLIDINQTRYEVHAIEDLDPHSQKLLRKYLLL
ncbi:MAG: DUF1854 domain-containing protein [Anaerolineae bacterium]|nr:DUF1854 domain-containing protein [Anaerolineae bacterium]